MIQKNFPNPGIWSLFLIRGLTQMPVMASHVIWTKTSFIGPKESRYAEKTRQIIKLCFLKYLSVIFKMDDFIQYNSLKMQAFQMTCNRLFSDE